MTATTSIIRRLSTRQATFRREFAKLLRAQETTDGDIDSAVDDILRQVRKQGDRALMALTRRLDEWPLSSTDQMEIPVKELRRTLQAITREQRAALEVAISRIQNYHQHQLQNSWTMVDADGSRYGQRIMPIDRVGLYVPGGRAVYPSSVLMNAVPALMAGVRELIMVTPTPHGKRNDLVLAAAYLTGVHRVFAIGGAQAIAALTYGTATIPKVDKIVGPGNAYVANAKRKVFGQVGIDMVAGPSEVLIISDGSGRPHWAALDMMAQAEHDARAQALLLSPRADYLDKVALQLQELLVHQQRAPIIRQSLKQRGALIHTRSLQEACELANEVAPEHLELAVRKPRSLLPQLRHAGAIFLGHHASESLGDYCAGPNHVLPTGGSARFSSPLGIYDFQKRTSLLEISRKGARKLIPIAACLAQAEGLQAHADSALARLRG